MQNSQTISSHLDLLDLGEELHSQLSASDRKRLQDGLRHFMDSLQIKRVDSSSAAELLIGEYQIELPEAVPETLVMVSELLMSHTEPSLFISSLPSISMWITGLYRSIKRVEIRTGALCVYRAVVSATVMPSILNPLDVEGISTLFPCRPPLSGCRFARAADCNITPKQVKRLIDVLVQKEIFGFDADGHLITLKR